MKDIVFIGSDEIIEVTIKDSDNSPINIGSLQDIIISCYQTKEDIIQQWILSDSQVTVVNESAGIVSVNLDRDNTKKLRLKRLYLEIAVKIANASFEDGYSLQKVSDIALADLKNSVS